MSSEPSQLDRLIESELLQLSDEDVASRIRLLLVTPIEHQRNWDYGVKDESFQCFTVLQDAVSNTAIVFCSQGFGPRSPWGLVFMRNEVTPPSIGMDSQWYTTFLQAFFESGAAADMPIWFVFKKCKSTGTKEVVSDKVDLHEAWAKVLLLKGSDPLNCYYYDVCVKYERE